MNINNPAVTIVTYARLPVENFIVVPGVGTMTNPHLVNDGGMPGAAADAQQDEDSVVMFPAAGLINEYRQYGNAGNNGDGTWRLDYMDAEGVWHVWVASFATRAAASWSAWDGSGGEVVAIGIRLTCTLRDTSGWSYIGELEVVFN